MFDAQIHLILTTFFGQFQELDPGGTGVLHPDNIPKAIETASYILHARLQPDLSFFMRTSRHVQVYTLSMS